jgi:uncharacterized protein
MILIDTGPLVANANKRDRHHEACKIAIASSSEPLLLSPLVMAEASHLIDAVSGPKAEAAFVASVASGDFQPADLITVDYQRMAELTETYVDLGLGATDASVIALAERLGVRKVLTLDHRHFTVVRPRHVEAFDLTPDIG